MFAEREEREVAAREDEREDALDSVGSPSSFFEEAVDAGGDSTGQQQHRDNCRKDDEAGERGKRQKGHKQGGTRIFSAHSNSSKVCSHHGHADRSWLNKGRLACRVYIFFKRAQCEDHQRHTRVGVQTSARISWAAARGHRCSCIDRAATSFPRSRTYRCLCCR